MGPMPSNEQAHPPAAVQFEGSRGSLQVFADGSIEFVPSTDTACFACCGGRAIELSGADVIGAAQVDGESIFVVYFCPKNSKSGRRHLRKIGPFKCDDVDTTGELVDQIRQGASSREELQPYGKTVLAAVNPVAGKGRGEDLLLHLQTTLHAAGISCDALVSSHAGHVINSVASQDLSPYVAILVVGGDGTVHEVLQGLRQHLQMPLSLRMPLCHVPSGSGNGIAATLGLWNDATAVHALVKGNVRDVDAATVRRASETQPLLVALSVQYGLLTDLDIGTEHLRKVLGGERFTYGAVREILKWNKHHARVAYCTNAAHTVSTSQGTGGTLKCPMLDDVSKAGCSLEQPHGWPSGWHVLDMDSIRYFNIAGPDWAALDARINPWGKLDDGLWELSVDKCRSRLDGLKMVLQTQSGKHEHSPMFLTIHAGAFIIEPVGSTTYLTVDGEKSSLEKLSVEVHRKLLTFVCAPDLLVDTSAS